MNGGGRTNGSGRGALQHFLQHATRAVRRLRLLSERAQGGTAADGRAVFDIAVLDDGVAAFETVDGDITGVDVAGVDVAEIDVAHGFVRKCEGLGHV